MPCKKKNSTATMVAAVSAIDLALESIPGFNHSCSGFAVTKKCSSSHTSGFTTLGGGSSLSNDSSIPNSNVLTKKEKLFCINTANNS